MESGESGLAQVQKQAGAVEAAGVAGVGAAAGEKEELGPSSPDPSRDPPHPFPVAFSGPFFPLKAAIGN